MKNWCVTHGKVWFQKGKMKGFAHPIEEGGETVGWCNRPEDFKEPVEKPENTPQETHPSKQPLEIAPQERGMWFKEVGEMIRCGILTRETILGEKKPVAKTIFQSYWANMLVGLSIRVENKDENS